MSAISGRYLQAGVLAFRHRLLVLRRSPRSRLLLHAADRSYECGCIARNRYVAMSWCDEAPPPLLLEGIAQFNRGEYFEQHETLEILWRAEARPVRRLYQGILQIGVAFHHLRRRNYHGVVYMLTRGSMYLTPFAPRCQAVDVGALLEAAALTLSRVEALGPTRLHEYDWGLAPRVSLVEPRPEALRGGS